jgi:hypothetical protein
MDILWPAVGISIIVGFVLYVLAGHWSRVLRQQAGTIRRLSDRVQMIEEVDNPVFRERIGESAPAPLEQVFTFSFRFGDRFWGETLGLSESDCQFVRCFGTFVGLVKLERWRSHTVATVTELPPNAQTATWQTRSLDYYHSTADRSTGLTLWELPLARPAGPRPPSLDLSLCANTLELTVRPNASSAAGDEASTIFRVPLDPLLLGEFRSHDPEEAANGNRTANRNGAGAWRAFYSSVDEDRGFDWQLRVIDLNRKIEWDRWKILESAGQVNAER